MEGNPKKVALATLGCKINQYDTSVIAEEVRLSGNLLVPFGPEAEVFIINTCTVTGKTDYKGRQLIRKAHSLNPEAILIVTGCYAQVQPDEIAKISGVDYIFGNSEKDSIASGLEAIDKRETAEVVVSSPCGKTPLETAHLHSYSGHTRAFLKIQDGCSESCAYCIIPRARGKSRSLPVQRVMEQIEWLASKGFKEVVLCGIHLGHYGCDISPQGSLFDLLHLIEEQGVVQRVRISSIEPNELHDDLIKLFADARHLCPHFHLSMQSGDSSILKAMQRRYSRDDFETLVHRILGLIPDAAIGVDVIVGFPGEGEVEFENTRHLIASLPVAYLHVFPYSNRPGTPASSLDHQVSPETIHTRSIILRNLGKEKRGRFYMRFVGRAMHILVENSKEPTSNLLKGFSRNYIPVLFEGEDGWKNQEIPIRIDEVRGHKVMGSI